MWHRSSCACMFIKSVLLDQPSCALLVFLPPKHSILSDDEDGQRIQTSTTIWNDSSNTLCQMRSKGIPRWTSHRRQALLIPVFGKKMYDILANLCLLASPSTKTYSVCWVDGYFKEAVCSEEVCDLWTIPFLHFCTSRKFKHLRIHSSTLVTSNHMQLRYTFEGGSTGQIHCCLHSTAIQRGCLQKNDVNFKKAVQIAHWLEAQRMTLLSLASMVPVLTMCAS